MSMQFFLLEVSHGAIAPSRTSQRLLGCGRGSILHPVAYWHGCKKTRPILYGAVVTRESLPSSNATAIMCLELILCSFCLVRSVFSTNTEEFILASEITAWDHFPAFAYLTHVRSRTKRSWRITLCPRCMVKTLD